MSRLFLSSNIEDGNGRADKIQLRRTKTIVAADIKLPPLVIKVVEHETTPEEKDFYESIYKGACVKFNTFVQKGTMLHNYAVRSAPALGSGVAAGCVCGRPRVGARLTLTARLARPVRARSTSSTCSLGCARSAPATAHVHARHTGAGGDNAIANM
eukprot:COSAG01_NODE_14258_length_1476_cov_4.254902_3_plen_156_part_00